MNMANVLIAESEKDCFQFTDAIIVVLSIVVIATWVRGLKLAHNVG
jgi:hypothetical protein